MISLRGQLLASVDPGEPLGQLSVNFAVKNAIIYINLHQVVVLPLVKTWWPRFYFLLFCTVHMNFILFIYCFILFYTSEYFQNLKDKM